MATLDQHIKASPALAKHLEAATLEQAIEWDNTDEKWIYCADEILEISSHAPYADKWVNALEDRFEAILADHS